MKKFILFFLFSVLSVNVVFAHGKNCGCKKHKHKVKEVQPENENSVK